MSKRSYLISLLACLGLWSAPLPAFGQTLLPYTFDFNSEQFEQAGLEMAEAAIQLSRFQRPDAALSRAKLATQLAPHLYQTWLILGSLYLQQDQVDQGIEALQKALSLTSDQTSQATIKFILGSAYFQKGDYQGAIAQLEAGLTIKPDTPPAWFDLGNAYLKLERYDQAIAAYQKAVKQDGTFWPAINNMGLVKYEQGDFDGAIKDWQTSINIDKEQAEPLLAVAVALYTQGKEQESIKLAETALSLDSRYADLTFLADNLWGKRLLKDTQAFLDSPQMKAILARLQIQPQTEIEEVER